MKLRTYLLALALCLGCFALSTFTTGCASANKTAFKVTTGTQVTVEHAIKVWDDWIGSERVKIRSMPAADQAKAIQSLQAKSLIVKDAYEKYQAAAAVVASAGAAYTRAVELDQGKPASAPLQTALNEAIAVASGTFADLLTLLERFGVKLT